MMKSRTAYWVFLVVGLSNTVAWGGKTSLTEDEVAVYRTFLAQYVNGSRTTVNIANRTTPLAIEDSDRRTCLKGVLIGPQAQKA
jgi:hypothetical protein